MAFPTAFCMRKESHIDFVPNQEYIYRVNTVPKQAFAADKACPQLAHSVLIEQLLRRLAEQRLLNGLVVALICKPFAHGYGEADLFAEGDLVRQLAFGSHAEYDLVLFAVELI